jgi:hypothetical protein
MVLERPWRHFSRHCISTLSAELPRSWLESEQVELFDKFLTGLERLKKNSIQILLKIFDGVQYNYCTYIHICICICTDVWLINLGNNYSTMGLIMWTLVQ